MTDALPEPATNLKLPLLIREPGDADYQEARRLMTTPLGEYTLIRFRGRVHVAQVKPEYMCLMTIV